MMVFGKFTSLQVQNEVRKLNLSKKLVNQQTGEIESFKKDITA